MATLNIKNVPDKFYKKPKERAGREHRSVAQEVIHLLSQTLDTPEPSSILELCGPGKELWRGIDAVTHVDQERESWD